MVRPLVLAWLILSGWAPGLAAQTAPAPWVVICDWLDGQADQLAADVETARQDLLVRAESSAPEWTERLSLTPPRSRAPGWGVLPEIGEDGPVASVAPAERRYDLEPISKNFVTAFRDGRVLARHTARDDAAAMKQAVADYERLRGDLENLRQHLAYHRQWQAAVLESPAFFAERNALVREARALAALRAEGGDPELVALREAELRDRVAPLTPVEGLSVVVDEDGGRRLPFRVATDVDDLEFLEAFRRAVTLHWNGSAAARARRVSIDLSFELVSPGAGGGSDADAERPDLTKPAGRDAYLARFPAGLPVLTSGAASTHAWQGQALLLGPNPVTPRTLAHEFGHLLGFSDAYLRGWDGDPDGTYGVVLVEWTGLVDDLMGNPGAGEVSEAMLDRLLDAYGDD
jgi:hypothetical protein